MIEANVNALAAAEVELRRRGLARDTIRVVIGAGRRLLDAVAKPVAEVAAQDVIAHVAAIERSGVARVTQAAAITRLRIFFDALVTARVVIADPTRTIPSVAGRSPPQTVLAGAVVEKLLAAALVVPTFGRFNPATVNALALRDRACLELLYGVGVRRSEAGAIRVLDVRLEDESVLVRRAKRGASQALPLPRSSVPHLRRYLVEGRPVLARKWKHDGTDSFLLAWSGAPLNGTGVWRVVKRVARRLDVDAAPHDFRRSLATHMVRDGVNVEVVRQVLGHASLTTTARYAQVDREDLRRAIGRLERA